MKMVFIWSLFTLIVVCKAAPARFINADAVEWLQTFGYLDKNSGESVDLQHYQNALERMQKVYEIPVTRDIDLLTEVEMLIPRCGVSDPERNPDQDDQQGENSNIQKRFVTSNNKWDKDIITYRISSYSNDMPDTTQRAIVREAFRIWGAVVPLTFLESNADVVDTDIGFYLGDHNDNQPFTNNVIAHAFPPSSSFSTRSLDGDIHINDAITFSADSSSEGFNFLAVMVHEIGHTLGLDHSEQRGAVMHEQYGTTTYLTNDDISGIQYIYGQPPSREIPDIPVAVQRPTSYDAIYYKDNAIHLIKDDKVFRQYPTGSNIQEHDLNNVLPGRPEHVDAATVLGDDLIYIKDNQVWRYGVDSILRESYPKSLSQDVDLMFASPSENSLYFFQGNNYYQTEGGSDVASILQPISSKFGSSVVGSDAAFVYDSDIIFVKDNLCYSYGLNSGNLRGPHDFSQDMDFTKCCSIQQLISPIVLMIALVSRYIFM